jgi:hypothetical protein
VGPKCLAGPSWASLWLTRGAVFSRLPRGHGHVESKRGWRLIKSLFLLFLFLCARKFLLTDGTLLGFLLLSSPSFGFTAPCTSTVVLRSIGDGIRSTARDHAQVASKNACARLRRLPPPARTESVEKERSIHATGVFSGSLCACASGWPLDVDHHARGGQGYNPIF